MAIPDPVFICCFSRLLRRRVDQRATPAHACGQQVYNRAANYSPCRRHTQCVAIGAGALQQMHRASAGIARQVSNSVIHTRVSRKLNTTSHIPFDHVDSIRRRLTHTALDYYLHSER